MIKAIVLCVVSAAVGVAVVSLTIDTDVTDRTTSVRNLFVPERSRETAASENRESARFAPPLESRGDIGGRGAAADELVGHAAVDPRAALQAARKLDGHWYRLDTIERIVSVWAKLEPSAALAYLEEVTDFEPDAWRRLLTRVFTEWAAVDPAQVLSFLLTPRGQSQLFEELGLGVDVVREIAVTRPGELLLAAGNLPKGEVRWLLRDAAIASLVERDFDFALRRAAIESPGSDKQQWITNIIEYWAPRDPAGALDWAKGVELQVPGTLRNAAVRIADSRPEMIVSLALCEITPFVPQLCSP